MTRAVCDLASAAAEMLDEPKEIGAERRLLSEGPPSFDQSFLSRVPGSDLGFAVAIVAEEIGHGSIEGGGDPPEPVEGNPPAPLLKIGERTW
jgi:hypothetical protein